MWIFSNHTSSIQFIYIHNPNQTRATTQHWTYTLETSILQLTIFFVEIHSLDFASYLLPLRLSIDESNRIILSSPVHAKKNNKGNLNLMNLIQNI